MKSACIGEGFDIRQRWFQLQLEFRCLGVNDRMIAEGRGGGLI